MAKQTKGRKVPISASVEEAVKLLKPIGVVMASMRCFQKTIGVITPKSVYTTTTQSGTHCIGVTW